MRSKRDWFPFAPAVTIWGCHLWGDHDAVAAMCEYPKETTGKPMWDGDYWQMRRNTYIVRDNETVGMSEWQSLPWVVIDQMRRGVTV